MNLAQFLRARRVEQFACWGTCFNCEEDALLAIDCFQGETERFGNVILYSIEEDYEAGLRCFQKGILLVGQGYWNSLLFRSPEQAQVAAHRINEQLQTPTGCQGNQLVFQVDYLDEPALYQAIASSEVEVVGDQVVVNPGIPDEDWTILGHFCWIPKEFKDQFWSRKPKILIYDLDAAESGWHRSTWIDATEDPGDIVQMIAWWLGQSPVPDADWWKVVTIEGFPPDYTPKDQNNLAELCAVAQHWEQQKTLRCLPTSIKKA